MTIRRNDNTPADVLRELDELRAQHDADQAEMIHLLSQIHSLEVQLRTAHGKIADLQTTVNLGNAVKRMLSSRLDVLEGIVHSQGLVI